MQKENSEVTVENILESISIYKPYKNTYISEVV